MFGMRLRELPPIKEAVATYMMRASEKLRAQHSLCKKFRVSIRTGMFNPEEAKYANGVVVDMPYPTDDVRLLTRRPSTRLIEYSAPDLPTAKQRCCC
ncbi:DNA polymerase V subunit UmuC [compost metagenome]